MKKIPLKVETFDPKSDIIEQTHNIEYTAPHERVWLAKHQTWALNNGKGIVLTPKST
jgi:hypothetical protein